MMLTGLKILDFLTIKDLTYALYSESTRNKNAGWRGSHFST